jgi:tetratricopeptide (TPR) repeat protein
MDAQSGSTSTWDYLDFDLEIREGDLHEYSVIVRSPAGEAQEQMSFPFDERALRDRLRDLEIALLRSGGTRRSLSREEQTVQDFGRSLFEALLVGDVRTRYLMSLDKAEQQDKGLRMKLRVQPPELAVIPWEFLYDPDRDYLCFSPDTPIVRYVDLRQPVRRLTVEPPLRILGMVASPRGLDPLDVEHEKGLMNEAIEELRDDGLVELTWLEGQTWRDLRRAMRRDGPWHVFHFVGHGDFDVARQEGAIALTNGETGREHLLRSRDLARLLDGHRYLRLVFLNSCEGARGSEGDPFSGTAAMLVHNRIPAVVAMQYEITDKAAIEFSRSFYEALADGWPVDAAVTDARVAVSMDSMLEWGTPVLYMRSPDGRLFDISTDAQSLMSTSEQTEDRDKDLLRRYRENVQSAWVDGALQEHEVERLKELANRHELNPIAAADIEREVMSDTIESILERQEQAAREEERRKWLDERYDRARRAHRDQEWQAVIDVFGQIRSEDPAFPDPEGLLASARGALDRMRKVADLYAEGQRYVDAGEWQQAMECFEEVQQLEPDYRDTEELLSRVRRELAPPSTAKVPDLSGQDVSQASSALTSKGLRLGNQREAPSDTVPEGQIIEQSPKAGGEVQTGSSVSVTVSLGPSTVEVPDLVGKDRFEARITLIADGLKVGEQSNTPSDEVPKGKIVRHNPAAGRKVKRGSSVHVMIGSGPSTVEVPNLASKSRDEERSTELRQADSLSLGDQAFIDELIRISRKYTGRGYYVHEAIPKQNLADARSNIPILPGERVIALVDNSSILSRGIGLAICGDGIRWRNYAENPVSKKLRGSLEWSEFADVTLREHHWAAEYGIEIGRDNVFVAWKDNTMDQHKLVKLLLDIQSLVKSAISH